MFAANRSLNFDPTPFDWASALIEWARILGIVLAVFLVLGWLMYILARAADPKSFRLSSITDYFRVLGKTLASTFFISPSRVFAIAQLTFRESVRRKALLVIVLFVLLFMFGGWFLADPELRPADQVNRHVSFVLTSIGWLTLPVILLLACWGLPQDIKNRSLHTVVTKPVQRSEIFVGRVLGFMGISTMALVIMGAVGYIWIFRQVPAEARSALIARVPVYGELTFTGPTGEPKKVGINTGDIWEYRSYIAGATQATAIWDFENVSRDLLVNIGDEDAGENIDGIVLESSFEAFRTHKGRMGQGLLCSFRIVKDLRQLAARTLGSSVITRDVIRVIQAGEFRQAGISLQQIGNGLETKQTDMPESAADSLVEGMFGFARLMEPFDESEVDFSKTKLAEAAYAVAEAAEKKDAKTAGVKLKELGKLVVDNADGLQKTLVDISADVTTFEVAEYRGNQSRIQTKYPIQDAEGNIILDANGEPVLADLFDDLCHGDRLRISVSLVDRNQYLGMARPDLFIRTPDRPFFSGYVKSLLGTLLMHLLIVLIAVTASTFVKGPVAILLTFTILIVAGPMRGFLSDLVSTDPKMQNRMRNYGTFESFKRLITHKNPEVETEDNTQNRTIKQVDRGIRGYLYIVSRTMPDVRVFSLAPYVANGFDVPFSAGLLRSLGMAVAYVLPCLLLGTVCLRIRELEAK